MEDFDLKAAREEIARGAFIRIPRLSQDEIDAHTRPKKRQAKKKYHFLSFDLSDDEDDLFGISYPPAKKSRRNKANSAISPSSAEPSNEIKRVTRKNSSSDAQRRNSSNDKPDVKGTGEPKLFASFDKLKPVVTTEVRVLKKPKEEAPSYSVPLKNTNFAPSENIIKKVEPAADPNSKVGKIRVKTAAELGSTVIFIDDDTQIPPANSTTTSRVPYSKNSTTNRSSSKADNTKSAAKNSSNMNETLIADLYAKLFTVKNQTKIRNVAEILQSIAENIKNNNERVQEITNNKELTDAEKLMRRCLAFQDLKRKQEENEMKLKEKFESLMAIFDDNNFELLFQLFFLGILKILIVSVSYFYKKGTIFKKLITLLHQSLTNSKFNDERVFKLLRSKDFRERCSTLVKYIEDYCKTESYSMLFLSDADKNLIRIKNPPVANESTAAAERNPSTTTQRYTRPEFTSVQQRESFLLDLLKESTPSASSTDQQQQWKTYAPAQKRNVSHTTTVSTSNSVPASNNPPPKSNTTTSSGNGYVNSFIFSDGQIKPFPNNVINIQTTEPSGNVRPTRPPNDYLNHFLNRPVPDGNPANTTYHMNTPYNAHNKVHHVNGLNGTHLLSTSNGNIENIQPGSFVNTNGIPKKVSKDNTWSNGPVNPSGLRSLLSNETPTDASRASNYSRFLEHYGATNLNLNTNNTASRGLPSMPRNNGWMG
ncbi:uncharacterized protein LOC135831131 [Planococcus citri]|uniref:uncharacterized protein LOC135831131 n=1 Tax=Planococcus citri TaxID=170843 RepID=UPI0031F8E65F